MNNRSQVKILMDYGNLKKQQQQQQERLNLGF